MLMIVPAELCLRLASLVCGREIGTMTPAPNDITGTDLAYFKSDLNQLQPLTKQTLTHHHPEQGFSRQASLGHMTLQSVCQPISSDGCRTPEWKCAMSDLKTLVA